MKNNKTSETKALEEYGVQPRKVLTIKEAIEMFATREQLKEIISTKGE